LLLDASGGGIFEPVPTFWSDFLAALPSITLRLRPTRAMLAT